MILNLTQHRATSEQVAQGVVDLSEKQRGELQKLLTFDELPTREELAERGYKITTLAIEWYATQKNLRYSEEEELIEAISKAGGFKALIGGAPFFMRFLEDALFWEAGIIPVYAFSKRESVEQVNENGDVRKVSVFRHVGFIEVFL